jgi:hypothetical protein
MIAYEYLYVTLFCALEFKIILYKFGSTLFSLELVRWS